MASKRPNLATLESLFVVAQLISSSTNKLTIEKIPLRSMTQLTDRRLLTGLAPHFEAPWSIDGSRQCVRVGFCSWSEKDPVGRTQPCGTKRVTSASQPAYYITCLFSSVEDSFPPIVPVCVCVCVGLPSFFEGKEALFWQEERRSK